VPLSKAEMESALRSAGCFIAGQTDNLVPADRELYKRRDVTGTVGSDPLIVGKVDFQTQCDYIIWITFPA
jgi:thymidine phosphorylase